MWSAIALAFGLAMDATAVSTARGLAGQRRGELIALPALFGGFQAGMSAIGWIAGRWAGPYIDRWDHWVAFGLLVAIGGKMLLDAWRGRSGDAEREGGREEAGENGRDGGGKAAPPATSIAVYLGLALATSIDAAAAGLTLPLVPAPPWLSLTLIGTITAACSAGGYLAGRVVGKRFGARLAALGGVALIAIAIDLLIRGLSTP
jgi:putative Mn2+ efflux pump MntP